VLENGYTLSTVIACLEGRSPVLLEHSGVKDRGGQTRTCVRRVADCIGLQCVEFMELK
jgi:hypothetical protein